MQAMKRAKAKGLVLWDRMRMSQKSRQKTRRMQKAARMPTQILVRALRSQRLWCAGEVGDGPGGVVEQPIPVPEDLVGDREVVGVDEVGRAAVRG